MAEYIKKQHLMDFLDGCIEEEKGNRSQVIVEAIKMVVERMPMVEIPPHGRLIDADALIKDGWTLRKEAIRMGGYVTHELPLNNPSIPTIIESTIGQLNSDSAVNEANANTSNAFNALDCVEERKKGEWDMFDLISSASCRCSNCGCKSTKEYSFCPNCGADMRKQK